MQRITIEFQDHDTTPDRLRRLAEELSIPVDVLIIRAIDAQLGAVGLEPIPDGFRPKDVLELARARGLIE